MIPLFTCEIPSGQDVCQLVFGADVFDLDFWGPDKFDRTANQEQLDEFWKHVSLSQPHCPQTHTIKLHDLRIEHLREPNQCHA